MLPGVDVPSAFPASQDPSRDPRLVAPPHCDQHLALDKSHLNLWKLQGEPSHLSRHPTSTISGNAESLEAASSRTMNRS